MIAEPDSRPRLTERRMLCGTLTVLFLLLFVGAVVGLVTWYRAESDKALALATTEQLWQSRLHQCQRGWRVSEERLMTMASRIGCLFEEGSVYHRAAQRGLSDATSRPEASAQVAAPNDTNPEKLPPLNVTLDLGNLTVTNGSLAAVRQLYSSGVRLFIGFPDSDDLLAVVRWARQHAPDAVLVSPSATATDLTAGGAGSPLLLSLGDAALAAALVCLLRQRGVRLLLPVAADTTYGRSLLEEIRSAALFDGGHTHLMEPTLYEPAAMAERSPRRTLLLSVRRSLATVYRRHTAALLFVSGGEMRHFLEDAGWDEELSAVPWFGTDSVALRGDILSTEPARVAAVRVNLTALIYKGADAASSAAQWAVLRQLHGARPEPAAPNILRAYEGAALLAELGRLVVDHGDTGRALGALRTAVTAGLTGASAMEAGPRRAGGRFSVAQVVARSTPDRQLLAAADADALWVVTGEVRLTEDPQQGVYLSRAVYSAAGAAHHLLRRRDLAALYAAVGGCRGDSLQLAAAQPSALSAVGEQLQLQSLPQRLLVPAAQPVRLELHCGESDSGLLHLALRCPAVELPGADTVFCRADTYRLVDPDQPLVGSGAVRWQHERHLVRCGAVSAECLFEPCEQQRSCVGALTDELSEWLSRSRRT